KVAETRVWRNTWGRKGVVDRTVKLTAEFKFGEFQPSVFFVEFQVFRSEDMKNWAMFTLIGMESLWTPLLRTPGLLS
ncbi:MAG: hypothetical protein OSB55_13720, partial [Verrucomicrobiota bacterium]|nr:hypothetical protein [Verrucomicrobiota bacterium]